MDCWVSADYWVVVGDFAELARQLDREPGQLFAHSESRGRVLMSTRALLRPLCVMGLAGQRRSWRWDSMLPARPDTEVSKLSASHKERTPLGVRYQRTHVWLKFGWSGTQPGWQETALVAGVQLYLVHGYNCTRIGYRKDFGCLLTD